MDALLWLAIIYFMAFGSLLSILTLVFVSMLYMGVL